VPNVLKMTFYVRTTDAVGNVIFDQKANNFSITYLRKNWDMSICRISLVYENIFLIFSSEPFNILTKPLTQKCLRCPESKIIFMY